MHWLSAAPNSLVGREEMHHAQCDASDSTCGKQETTQAAADFHRIISARSKELKKGGRMVIVNFAKSAAKEYLGKTDIGVSMWDSFQSSWDRLARENLITEVERTGISFPNFYRSIDEVSATIKSFDNLKIVSIEEKVVRCPYRSAWNDSNKQSRTPREHAEWYVPTTRTWSEAIFKNALDDSRDKDAIMKKFWSNYVDLVAEDPSVHGMDYVHTYTVIEKLH